MTGDPVPASFEPDFALLRNLEGKAPPAPAWFMEAIGHEPERTFVTVEGCPVELLAWGPVGAPGVLLLSGDAANADWWSFIAPNLAQGRRVAAFSWSGMGRSGWRERYPVSAYLAELLECAKAAGLFLSDQPPVLVAHSFGGFPALMVAADDACPFSKLVLIDTKIRGPGATLTAPARYRPHRVYPSEAAALARFRLLPPQLCENLFAIDFIARHSLKRLDLGQGEAGWSWRFDPNLYAGMVLPSRFELLQAIRPPVSYIHGRQSKTATSDVVERVQEASPACRIIGVEDCGHHVMLDQPLMLTRLLQREIERA